MKLAASEQLFSYWTRLRGARGAPERNDIDPAAIRAVLADTFILEFNPTAGFPLRISGSRTNALFLRELRGEPFLELWRPQDRAEASEILGVVANEAQPFLLGAMGGPPGVEATNVEVLLLPLRHHGATHSRMLGVCAPRSLPRWLGLLPIGVLALTSLRALTPSQHNGAEVMAHDFVRRGNLRRRGHLFVYSSET
ncbi:MAG TPA: PAS domain-containing protein [Roseiarcus sp.]